MERSKLMGENLCKEKVFLSVGKTTGLGSFSKEQEFQLQ